MFFFTDVVEGGAELFPIDERVEFRQKVVMFIDFFESVGVIEKSVLAGGLAQRATVYRKKAERRGVPPDD